MNFLDEKIQKYLSDLLPARDPVLAEMEARAKEERFPIIGPLVGRLCQQVALSIDARDVFEMGSGFGYSTMWFAEAVGERGRVVHTDGDPQNSADAKSYHARAGVSARIVYEVGDAIEILKKYPGPFDIVFIDIDKHGYPEALELARSRVREGGYIITDNTLWSGRVTEPAKKDDADTAGIQRHNQDAYAAPDLFTTIIPIRDGVALSLKLPQRGKARR